MEDRILTPKAPEDADPFCIPENVVRNTRSLGPLAEIAARFEPGDEPEAPLVRPFEEQPEDFQEAYWEACRRLPDIEDARG